LVYRSVLTKNLLVNEEVCVRALSRDAAERVLVLDGVLKPPTFDVRVHPIGKPAMPHVTALILP
jgi:hypothetical protein